MNSANNQTEQSVFVNGRKLKGAVAVDGSYSHSFRPLNILGQGCVKTIFADVPQADFSINRTLTFFDVFDPFSTSSITKLGTEKLRGSINYGSKVFGFETGYLSSYSYAVSYGDLPQSNIGIKVFGDIGSGMSISPYDSSASKIGTEGTLNATGSKEEKDGYPIYPSNIELTFRNSTSNRVTNFSLSSNINYNEIYAINSIIPIEVSPKYPLEVLVDFTVELDDYETKRMTDSLLTGAADPFTINVYSSSPNDVPVYGFRITGGALQQFALQGGDGTPLFLTKAGQSTFKLFSFSSSDTTKLVSEQFSASADDVTSVKLSYITYVNNVVDNSVYNVDNSRTRVISYSSVLDRYENG